MAELLHFMAMFPARDNACRLIAVSVRIGLERHRFEIRTGSEVQSVTAGQYCRAIWVSQNTRDDDGF
jgi:hypothetical protein